MREYGLDGISIGNFVVDFWTVRKLILEQSCTLSIFLNGSGVFSNFWWRNGV
jgi:hypothetical protein